MPRSPRLLFLILLHLSSHWAAAGDQSPATAAGGGGELWCVAKNNAEDAALQTALDWACGPGGADCRPIQQGGACYDPQDIQSHASFAFNDYFIRNGFASTACDFAGTAALTALNPSHGSCNFPSSSSARNGSFVGSSTGGLGPAGADMSSGPPLQPKTWTRMSTVTSLAILTASTIGSTFIF